ncbi:MAG: TetR/AcrR family transcriptional regulator [Lachnospiraceae bacterium]|nr:TetR/AcrR family transcriptional regulator [Lachnospiraceae bacterium]
MPKIIENVRETLILEARKQIETVGYAGVTVRSIASACGVGVGTVYNYFKSKDMLVATCILEDWSKAIGAINDYSIKATNPEEIFRCIYTELKTFIQLQKAIFEDAEAIKVFNGAFSERHKMLRGQLAEPIKTVCNNANIDMGDGFMADFIAESILTWTVAGRSYEDISVLLLKLLK